MSMTTRKTLANLLVERNLLTHNQLEDSLAASKEAHQPLAEYLRVQGLIDEKDLISCYAELFKLPVIETITEKMADPDLLARIPRLLCNVLECLLVSPKEGMIY